MAGGVGVEPPAPLPPVLQLVSLGKLLALTAPVPAVGLLDHIQYSQIIYFRYIVLCVAHLPMVSAAVTL